MDEPRQIVCAIYTRKSSQEGLEQAINSLDAQREACEAYICSQKHAGWRVSPATYDDGGFSGGSLERPALQQLLDAIRQGQVHAVVVYKVDRLTRSLVDFSKLVELFDAHQISFVSVTQHFNTASSMGRLTLNVLLSFAKFEREVTGERIRDKLAASAKKGLWLGGPVPLGYDALDRRLIVNEREADLVRHIFRRYLALHSVARLRDELERDGHRSKARISKKGVRSGGHHFGRGALYRILQNRIYRGDIVHNGEPYPGEQDPIVERPLWDDVQQHLAHNRTRRALRSNARDPSLLAGILFDEHGQRLSPSHAVKNKKRYRYYVSQAPIQGRPDAAGTVRRIAAHEIEHQVCTVLLAYLQDQPRLLDDLCGARADEPLPQAPLAEAKRMAAGWDALPPAEQRALMHAVVQRVVVSTTRIKVVLSRNRLQERLGIARDHASRDEPICLQIDARLMRSGGETKLIVAGEPVEDDHPGIDAQLVEAVVQAHAWKEAFLEDPQRPLKAYAAAGGLSVPYTARIMRLAYLAPDITQAILQGSQPRRLSLKTLLRGIPKSWSEQRRRFGFRPVDQKPKIPCKIPVPHRPEPEKSPQTRPQTGSGSGQPIDIGNSL